MKHHIVTEQLPQLRTPYHELGELGVPTVPAWARRRSVYRNAGRTTYLVETDRLDKARRDLDTLARKGWDVEITRAGKNAASVAVSRTAFAKAA